MHLPVIRPLTLAVLTALSAAVNASDNPSITVSGFGTAALTVADTDAAEYVRPLQARGAGSSPRSGVDSNLGLQATAVLNDSLSFTVQGLVRKNALDHYGADLSWAFAKFKVNKQLSLRVGRMGLPVYMVSDFRNVGYANTMIRPSFEVYNLVPADSFTGVDAVYQQDFGATTITAQLSAGRLSTDLPGGTRTVIKPVVALNVSAQHGPLTLRFGRNESTFSVDNATFLAQVNADLRAAGLTQLADDLRFRDVDAAFTSAGFVLDWRNLYVQGEYAVRRTATRFVPDATSWYTMAGYRMGSVMPYAAFGTSSQDDARTYAGAPTSGPSAPLGALANALVKMPLQSTTTLGVRWDFAPAGAFKFQADRVRPRDGNGGLVNVKPGFSGPVMVYAAGIDFVF